MEKKPKPNQTKTSKTPSHIYTMEYYLVPKKEGNPAICGDMDKFGGHNARWNKPDKDKQILHAITYM